MDEKLIKELALIKAYEIKYGTDEFCVMDALMERKGFYGNWSVDIIGDRWEDIEKMGFELLEKINSFINS